SLPRSTRSPSRRRQSAAPPAHAPAPPAGAPPARIHAWRTGFRTIPHRRDIPPSRPRPSHPPESRRQRRGRPRTRAQRHASPPLIAPRTVIVPPTLTLPTLALSTLTLPTPTHFAHPYSLCRSLALCSALCPRPAPLLLHRGQYPAQNIHLVLIQLRAIEHAP